MLRKILLCDDHPLIRSGMHAVLTSQISDVEIFESSSGKEALNVLQKTKFELLILDLKMPDMDGITLLKQIKGKANNPPTLIVSMTKDIRYIRECMSLGVWGYVLKDDGTEALLAAVKSILYAKKKYFSSSLVPYLVQDYKNIEDREDFLGELSKREKEVLFLLIDGLTSKEIGKQLKISNRTVDHHRSRVLSKADVRNTAELINFYRDLEDTKS